MAEIVFVEIAWILLAAAAIGLVGALFRQPVIVSFIAVGILAAAFFQGAPETTEQVEYLAELGVTVLLFLVGLKLDWRLVRTLGPVALATGLGQVLFTSVVGFGICLALGFDAVTSLYVAVALTFSSTIIVVKLLGDKRELDSLHGRIALGFLIVQDIVVVIAMVVLSAVGVGSQDGRGLGDLVAVIGALAVAVILLVLFVRFAAESLMARFARSPDLVIIFAIGWAAAAASLADTAGLGKELGGLIAGVSLGSTSFRDMISARLSAVRDFLLLFFFLSIGASLDIERLGSDVPQAVLLSLFVLIGNPLIVIAIMAWMGYRARTGFLAGLTVAQISEFSLIFMAMGLSLGHVNEGAVGLVTLVGLVTIAASVYMITYSHQLYRWVKPFLRPFDFGRRREGSLDGVDPRQVDVLLFGLGRFGSELIRRLENAGMHVLGIDMDPQAVADLGRAGYATRYGDVTEQEFWADLPLAQARWVILAVPYGSVILTGPDPRGGLMAAIRSLHFTGRIAITARDRTEELLLQEGGVDLVLSPFDDAAAAAAAQIEAMDAPAPDAAGNTRETE
ncbi:MAG: cation:proton antiporter [Bauldia sp.]|nr:cation:proton antiporter [Bauldia sp.]